jgi:hypothetical protein
MLFKIRNSVPAKRKALDADLDVSEITHQFKILKLQTPTSYDGLSPLRSGDTGGKKLPSKTKVCKASGTQKSASCGPPLM